MEERKDKYQSNLERVIHMEELYDRICAAIEAENSVAERLKELQDDIKELEAYYEGPEWLEDYDAEQRGEFPKDLKRGILAEDTLYDLLCDLEEY